MWSLLNALLIRLDKFGFCQTDAAKSNYDSSSLWKAVHEWLSVEESSLAAKVTTKNKVPDLSINFGESLASMFLMIWPSYLVCKLSFIIQCNQN